MRIESYGFQLAAKLEQIKAGKCFSWEGDLWARTAEPTTNRGAVCMNLRTGELRKIKVAELVLSHPGATIRLKPAGVLPEEEAEEAQDPEHREPGNCVWTSVPTFKGNGPQFVASCGNVSELRHHDIPTMCPNCNRTVEASL